MQNWSHVLSYVSKAESTPEIAEVTCTLPASSDHCWPQWALSFSLPLQSTGWGWGPPGNWGGYGEHKRLTCAAFPLQQRGERDNQTQGILTKLKCAAGEGPGAQGGGGTTANLVLLPLWVACVHCTVASSQLGQTLEPHTHRWPPPGSGPVCRPLCDKSDVASDGHCQGQSLPCESSAAVTAAVLAAWVPNPWRAPSGCSWLSLGSVTRTLVPEAEAPWSRLGLTLPSHQGWRSWLHENTNRQPSASCWPPSTTVTSQR